MFLNKSNPVDALLKKSSNILDVFTKTITELTAVNEEIAGVTQKKEIEKAELEKDITILNERSAENSKVIDKIKNIFS